MNKNIVIILARKGSKRIKSKNIINFFNMPLIYTSIYQAKKTKLFDQIIVSTDSKKIKRISEKFGAKVPILRSKKNSSDNATTADVIKEVLNYKFIKNIKYEYCCVMYASSPFIKSVEIVNGYKNLVKKKLSTFFQVTKIETHPHKHIIVKKK